MATFRLIAYRIQIKKLEIHGRTKGDKKFIAFGWKTSCHFKIQMGRIHSKEKNILDLTSNKSYFSILGKFT